MEKSYFTESLERCKSYGDIFEVVKKAVRETIGLHRAGLMLYLRSLPPNIGAYYQVGSNGIVLNKLLVSVMSRSFLSKTEYVSFVFSLLLHEYLHSLGFLDERKVRRLVYGISVKTFGEDHPTVKMALNPPNLSAPLSDFREYYHGDFEIVRDFERTRNQYII